VAVALAAAIDDGAAVRRDQKNDRAGAAVLTALARAADPDSWRAGLRAALERPDREARRAALRELADAAPFEALGPVSLDLLGRALGGAGDPVGAEAVLRRAQRRHPQDVWISYDLARALADLARRSEAIRYYAAARALRPETAHQLAHALEKQREGAEALADFEDLADLRPENGWHWVCLGNLRQERSDRAGAAVALGKAVTALREAIRLKPDDAWVHDALGITLLAQGKVSEAVAPHREAMRLNRDPNYPNIPNNVPWAPAMSPSRPPGDYDEAAALARRASRSLRGMSARTSHWRWPSTAAAAGTTRSQPPSDRWACSGEEPRATGSSW
jgi:Flp pilus assembly protein TadD